MAAGRRLAKTMRRGAAVLLLSASMGASAVTPEAIDLVVTTSDGRIVRVADYRGRWLLVNYWATWCSACVAEMPTLSRMAERDPRIGVLGLTGETLTAQQLRTFLADRPVTYPVASVDKSLLPVALAPTAFGIGMRPISYLIAPDGTVVERILGGVDIQKIGRRIDERAR